MSPAVEYRRTALADAFRVSGRAAAAGQRIEGYAAVYFDPANLPGTEFVLYDDLVEHLMPGCFDRALKEVQDVRLLVNHDPNLIIARTSASSLSLSVDKVGLKYVARDFPRTTAAEDLLKNLASRNITGSSFAFVVAKVAWSEDKARKLMVREIYDLDLHDVSCVTYPAYKATRAGVRAVPARGRLNRDQIDATARLVQTRAPPGGLKIRGQRTEDRQDRTSNVERSTLNFEPFSVGRSAFSVGRSLRGETMSVVSVAEIWNGRRGSADEKAEVEYDRVFRVVTNDPLDGTYTASTGVDPVTGVAIPALFSIYLEPGNFFSYLDSAVIVRKIDVTQEDIDPQTWIVTVHYSNKTDQPEQGHENPLLRPAEIKWSFAQFQKIATEDLYGNSVFNSAGEPFDPPPEKDDSRPVLVITKNRLGFDPAVAYTYRDAVNSDWFFDHEPGTAKIQSIEGARLYENNVLYWQVTTTIHFRPEGWKLKILDNGYHKLDDDDEPSILMLDKFAHPLASPGRLSGRGQPLKEATSTLDGPMTDDATSLVIADPLPLPVTNLATAYLHEFVVKIDEEKILVPVVQSVPYTTWTDLTRGYQGTTPAAHAGPSVDEEEVEIDGATVQLQPVYLNYLVYNSLSFAALKLL